MNKAKLTFTNQTKSIVYFCFSLFFPLFWRCEFVCMFVAAFFFSNISFVLYRRSPRCRGSFGSYYIFRYIYFFCQKISYSILRRCSFGLNDFFSLHLFSFGYYIVVNLYRQVPHDQLYTHIPMAPNERNDQKTVNSSNNLPKNEVHTTGAHRAEWKKMPKFELKIVSFIINSISIIRSIIYMKTAFFFSSSSLFSVDLCVGI